MDDALGADPPAEGGGAGGQLGDRYAIGAQLSQDDRVQTFGATDRLLDRPVVLVLETESGEGTLAETSQAMTDVHSPNLVEIYDIGGSAAPAFVVCELPMSTVSSLVQDPGQSLWNEGWARNVAEQLALALADAHGGGLDISGLHMGYIGIDGNGHVRLSPWPLAEPPDAWPAPASEQELVASVLESGASVSRSSRSKTAEPVESRPPTPSGDVPFAPDFLPAALTGLGVSVDDKPSGDTPTWLNLPSSMFAGVEPQVDDEPTGEVPITPDFSLDRPLAAAAGVEPSVDDKATGRAPVISSAGLLSQDAATPVDREQHRKRWALAAGLGLTGLAAFLAFSLVSSNPPAPANASTSALKAPSSTIAGLRLPVTPMPSPVTTVPPSTTTTPAEPKATTTPSGAVGGAAPPVDTGPPATDAPSTTTTVTPSTTTTTPPSTTTTTAASSTTTTTVAPPPTTTTTVPPSTTTTLAAQ